MTAQHEEAAVSLIEKMAAAFIANSPMGYDGDEETAASIMAVTEHRGDCTNEPFTCACCEKEDAIGAAHAALQALSDAGYVVVPKEATEEMANAWAGLALKRIFSRMNNDEDHEDWGAIKSAKESYRTMLVAAPEVT